MREEPRSRILSAVTAVVVLAFGAAVAAGLLSALVATRHPDLRDAAPVAAASDGAARRPGFDVCGTTVVQPSTFPERCGSGRTAFNNLRWSSWGGRSAFGVGEYWITDLDTGSSQSFPIRLQLGGVTGKGSRARFTRVTMTFSAQPPDSALGDRVVYRVRSSGLTAIQEQR